MTRFISYPIIAIFLVMSIYPFAWMFFSSFKTNQEIYQPTQLIPKDFDGGAYSKLWAGDFWILVPAFYSPSRSLPSNQFWLPSYRHLLVFFYWRNIAFAEKER